MLVNYMPNLSQWYNKTVLTKNTSGFKLFYFNKNIIISLYFDTKIL